MNARTRLQLRLQATVEGLSVAAISYYVVGLFGYVVKGAHDAGLHDRSDTCDRGFRADCGAGDLVGGAPHPHPAYRDGESVGSSAARPREGGDPEKQALDSRFRGNERSMSHIGGATPRPTFTRADIEGAVRLRHRGNDEDFRARLQLGLVARHIGHKRAHPSAR